MGDGDRELDRLDVAQGGAFQDRDQALSRATLEAALAGVFRRDLVNGLPQRPHRRTRGGQVPHGRPDPSAGPRHPLHLGETSDGVGHEVHDQAGRGDVEGVVVEGQGFRCAQAYVDARVSRAAGHHERLGRIDGGHLGGADESDEVLGQRPRSAPDIEDALPGRDAQPVREARRQRTRVPPHEPVVRLAGDVEGHATRRYSPS